MIKPIKDCKQYRDELEKQVLALIDSQNHNTRKSGSKDILTGKTFIFVDASPYNNAQEAVSAEMEIDWFDPEQLKKQTACRKCFAATELQYYLRRITGRDNDFKITNSITSQNCLIIEYKSDTLAVDGSFEIKKNNGNFIFTGQSIQAPLYAVYEYLNQLGCRFLRPNRTNDYIPKLSCLYAPEPVKQKPGFRIRRLHDYRKNRATKPLLDWMAKARINLWGSDNIIPGMRKRGICLSSGMHDVLPVVGLDNDFCICNSTHKKKLVNGIIEAFSVGPWKDADVVDYIGADWGKRCTCNKCRNIGTPTDIELYILGIIRKELHEAYEQGKINRDLPVMGYAYFDSEQPPARRLENDFDSDNISVELWVMRCWEHFIDEKSCSEDFPIVSKMHDFSGKHFDLPGNNKIHQRILGWLGRTSEFRGEMGFGYYLSNAGNYWLPLCQMSILSYEIPYLHSIGVRRLGYMHISPDNWGPKAVVNMLYSKLSWNKLFNPAELLADYFICSYSDNAAQMAQVYFDLERAMANVFNIKRFFIRGVQNFGYEAVKEHSHINLSEENQKAAISFEKASQLASSAFECVKKLKKNDVNGLIKEDLPWLEYAAGTIELYRLTAEVLDKKHKGYMNAAINLISTADPIINRLKQFDLEICLPEKTIVDCAEASGILELLNQLADDFGITLNSLNANAPVQTSIEPVKANYIKQGHINPTRWFADPNWPVTPDGDEIGLEVTELIKTDIKHMGVVAQKVGDNTLIASVGDDIHTKPETVVKWQVLSGSSVICFDGQGNLRWRHNFSSEGMKINCGPWPAFIDINGAGKWAVSVFVMYDGGEKNRKGIIYMYDALTGNLIWQRKIPDHPYPGGNGSCVAADLDGDGKIEIVYGLCNCIMCVQAENGKTKWIFDEGIIKICHGRIALCDVNDDGIPEIVAATEYGDDKENAENDKSSIITLNGNGKLIRRMSNIQGDLGSTQIVCADVDKDGFPEIIHGSENLCFHEPRHMAELMIRERYLVDKIDPIPVGGVRFAIGDIDGDGYHEAVGITTYRDGGPYVRPEIYCVRVLDGRIKWKKNISRFWLDGDAVMADIDGDGQLEAVVTANYPSGYMQEPGTAPWSDLYIIKADSRIIYKKTFPDSIMSPVIVDADADGKVEIVAGCYDGKVYLIKTPAPACQEYWPVVCQNDRRTGVYPNTTKTSRD